MLGATAMVLLMTPALGFFYAGMVRSKNTLNTLMMSLASLGVVGVVWALAAYSLAFAPGNAFLGGGDHLALNGVALEAKGKIPHLLFMAYQMTFAIITAALISGAIVERMRFAPYLAFISLWTLVVYAPLAHWVWGGGWLSGLGALDFAGGTVVHVNAGVTALVLAKMLGQRKEYGRQAMLPHNVPFVLLGTALLWFGWFGFNAGSALEASPLAALAFVNTMLAPMATFVTWILLDLKKTGKVTAVGGATAIIVGLVAITPGAGFVGPLSALAMGALAAFPSYFALHWRPRTHLDDSLDVFAGHGLGGLTGALLTGLFASSAWGAVDGGLHQLGIQALAVAACGAYSAVMTCGLVKVLERVTNLRVSTVHEGRGLDLCEHGEQAYANGEGAILLLPQERPVELRPVLKPQTA